jgi:hypothetical protein
MGLVFRPEDCELATRACLGDLQCEPGTTGG